jgi:phospholipid transport system transporter-binding protein
VLTLPAVVEHDQALAVANGLIAQVSSQPASVVLDASALMQFDSSALAVILACRRESLAAGKTFSIQGLPAKLGQLAGLYGVAELITAAA